MAHRALDKRIRKTYGDIAARCGILSYVCEIIAGDRECPTMNHIPPPIHLGFPPALIPCCYDQDIFSFRGIWKRWFSEDRHSAVKFSSFYGPYYLAETGRTDEQLLLYCLECITHSGTLDQARDGERVAELAGIRQEDLLCPSGRGVYEYLSNLPPYQGMVPLLFALEAGIPYDGNFPDPRQSYGAGLARWSFFELGADWETLLKTCPESFAWHGYENIAEAFHQALSRNDLNTAWLCLNSLHWRLNEVRDCLQLLAGRSRDATFQLLADTWCSLPEPEYEFLYK